MKKIYILILSVMLALVVGCQSASVLQDDNGNDHTDGKLAIVTTLFPQYDFARTIAGDLGTVSLLLPPGVESHAYDPTPRDIVTIKKSDIFIYTGDFMEPWVGDILSAVSSEGLLISDVSENITLLKAGEEMIDSEALKEDDHGEYDPHFWLNPQNAVIMVDNILKALIETDPEHEAEFTERAEALKSELMALDASFETFFSTLDNPQIVYGGHYAFAYFSERYGLTYISPYNGFAPDAELTPRSMAALIDAIRENHFTTIYYEELVTPKVAEGVSEETGVKMLLLHGAHNVSKTELESGVTYISIMYENLERLKEGLLYE